MHGLPNVASSRSCLLRCASRTWPCRSCIGLGLMLRAVLLLTVLVHARSAPDVDARLVPPDDEPEGEKPSSSEDEKTEVVWVTEGSEAPDDKGPHMLSPEILAKAGLASPPAKSATAAKGTPTPARSAGPSGRPIDTHAKAEAVGQAPIIARVEAVPPGDDSKPAKNKKAHLRPTDIFPADDGGLASRDHDGAEIVVISDGTQEGLNEGLAAEAAAATAAAPRPDYAPLDVDEASKELVASKQQEEKLPGRQKATTDPWEVSDGPSLTDDPCELPHPPGIGDENDLNGRSRWSRFYTLRDVCVTQKMQCGGTLPTGFGIDGSSRFNPLDAFQEWLDIVPAGCNNTGKDVPREGTGLAFTVQHYRAFNPDSILHQASSSLSLDWDAAYTRGMQAKLAHTSSVLLPQFTSREQLEEKSPWLLGMLDVVLPRCVLPHLCTDGQPNLRSCENMSAPVCFDELLIHRQVGPWLRRNTTELTGPYPVGRKFFPEFSDARRFQRRAAEILGLPKCPPVYKRLTLTLAVRRDATGCASNAT